MIQELQSGFLASRLIYLLSTISARVFGRGVVVAWRLDEDATLM